MKECSYTQWTQYYIIIDIATYLRWVYWTAYGTGGWWCWGQNPSTCLSWDANAVAWAVHRNWPKMRIKLGMISWGPAYVSSSCAAVFYMAFYCWYFRIILCWRHLICWFLWSLLVLHQYLEVRKFIIWICCGFVLFGI